jgi:hypothetical protein
MRALPVLEEGQIRWEIVDQSKSQTV